jgi:hypothetical protein
MVSEEVIFDEIAAPKRTSQPQNEKAIRTLSELLSETTTKKPIDVEYRIEKYLFSKHTQRDIAMLKIALEELKLIIPCETTVFREALYMQYHPKIKIIVVRGVQKVEEELNALTNNGTMIKDLPKNRKAIDAIKNILSN